jgi:hypothetical protein
MLNTRISLCAAIAAACVAGAHAATYNGSLTYSPFAPPDPADELYVGPSNLQWVNYNVGISWTVTDTDTTYPSHPWKYTYTFGHDGGQAAISHLIIEVSEEMTLDDMVGLTGAGLDATDPIALHEVAAGNPNMPEAINGLKLNPPNPDDFTMTFSFYSNRRPVWGDFYARCGGKLGGINFAYNYNMDAFGAESGFLSPDSDPAADASTGTPANHYYYHILRPDTVVPEPATLALLSLGCLVVLRTRR